MKRAYYAKEYKRRRWGIYCRTTRSFIQFGPKARIQRRCAQLNDQQPK